MTGLKAPRLDHFAFKGAMTLGGVEPTIARLRAGALAISGQGQVSRAGCRSRTAVGALQGRCPPGGLHPAPVEPPGGVEPPSPAYETGTSPAMLRRRQVVDGLDWIRTSTSSWTPGSESGASTDDSATRPVVSRDDCSCGSSADGRGGNRTHAASRRDALAGRLGGHLPSLPMRVSRLELDLQRWQRCVLPVTPHPRDSRGRI